MYLNLRLHKNYSNHYSPKKVIQITHHKADANVCIIRQHLGRLKYNVYKILLIIIANVFIIKRNFQFFRLSLILMIK